MGFRIGSFLKTLQHQVRRAATSAETFAAEGTHAAKEVLVRTGGAALEKIGHGPAKDQFASGKLEDPSLTIDEFKKLGGLVTQQPAQGRLFVNGAQERDVQQGHIGDCYFLASLAAVARTKPGFLEQHLVRNPDGTVTATFYENGRKIPVTVDADLPKLNLPLLRNVDLLASSSDPNELWPALYEKAFATWKGSYDAIGQGGYIADALRAITGMNTRYESVLPGYTQPNELALRLKQVVDAGQPLAASTREGEFSDGLEGLVGHHVYTIDKVEQRGADWYVTVRNPWGTGEKLNLGRPDGTFTLKASEFVKAFNGVTWAE